MSFTASAWQLTTTWLERPVHVPPPRERQHPEARSTSVPLPLGVVVVVLARVVARVVERSRSIPLRWLCESRRSGARGPGEVQSKGVSWICLHFVGDDKMGASKLLQNGQPTDSFRSFKSEPRHCSSRYRIALELQGRVWNLFAQASTRLGITGQGSPIHASYRPQLSKP